MVGGDLQQKVSEQTVTVERQERELTELKHKMELLVKKAKEQSKIASTISFLCVFALKEKCLVLNVVVVTVLSTIPK